MESSDLRDVILNGLADRLSGDGAMATGHFVLVAEVLDADGTHATFVACPPSQPTHSSLGLLGYATEWYKTEAHIQMMGAIEAEDDDD